MAHRRQGAGRRGRGGPRRGRPSATYMYSANAPAAASSPATPVTPETILGANLASWWDASDASTVTSGVSDHVSLWEDKSAAGIDFDTSSNPQYEAQVINGLNAIHHDHPTSYRALRNTTATPVTTPPFTFWVVSQWDTGADAFNRAFMFSIYDTANSNNYYTMTSWQAIAGDPTYFNGPGFNIQGNPPSGTAFDVPHVWRGSIDASNAVVWALDGVVMGSGTHTPPGWTPDGTAEGGQGVNAVWPWGGYMCEIVTSNAVDDDDNSAMEAYLISKWGV